MEIRSYQPGDEARQLAIYNAAAGGLPKFKPATLQDVERRVRARDFDPEQRWYATEAGSLVGYCLVNANGRVSFPWCLPGHEGAAEPLFARALAAARQRGRQRLFAAYRGDWPAVHAFFEQHGFARARDIVNYIVEFVDMPTPTARAGSAITPLNPSDVPAVLGLMPEALRVHSAAELHDHLFKNPHFTSDALFALCDRHGAMLAAGILVYHASYADPHAVDSAMPCFRLGAFGAEGMQTKRLKGLFSFLARPESRLPALAMDLLLHAAYRLRDADEVTALAGQAASDAPSLLAFYERNFTRQGSFPVFEMSV